MELPATTLARRRAPRYKTLAVMLLLMVSFSALAQGVLAAGDSIQVLSNNWEFRFPGDVVFNLEVEGEVDIVEVRLYYRADSSGPWIYAYPGLTPSRRVETSLNLKLSGMSYIPPGTEVEYYYSILDSQGNMLETSPETFVYFDNRFRWRTTNAGLLTIFWHDVKEKRVRQVAQQVEKSLLEISQRLQVTLNRPVRGIIYNSRAEARQALPYLSQTITDQQVFQGFAFPDRGAFVGIGLDASLIVHESAHLLLREATDSPRAKVPAWVDEGFASYVEPGAHGSTRSFPKGVSPGTIPLKQMYSVPGRPEDIRFFYRKAESVVGYLLESDGPAQFREFLQGLTEGQDSDEALITAYGFGLGELERRWASAVGQGEGREPSNGASPLPYLDTALIGVIVVVVTVVLAANYLVRNLRRRKERLDESDGLTEDEWEGRP